MRMTPRFDLLVVAVNDEVFREGDAVGVLEDLEATPVSRVVLELENVSDEVLPRVASLMKVLGATRRVAVCGVQREQVSKLTSLGIAVDDLFIGRWPVKLDAA
jgi:hypothetical protein